MYTYVILVGFIGIIGKIWGIDWGFIVYLEKNRKTIYDIVLHDNSFQSTKNLTPKSKVKFFISYHEFHLTSLTRCLTICCIKRSEEHTSELQSRGHLVCRLLLE